jgi:uncharacterized HAD superfamily protein
MIVIIDIDDTLALNTHRYQISLDVYGNLNWDTFYKFENVISDIPNIPMVDLVKNYKKDGYKIVIFTGRPEAIRDSTEFWLKRYEIPYDSLHMRSSEDHYISDVILKLKMYETHIDDEVFCAFDDMDSIIKLWVSMGIPTFKVYT